MFKSKRSKACDISKKVKEKVWERDNHRCIMCGSPNAFPNAHFISRSKGGLGIEENIITLCKYCHNSLDNTVNRTHFLNIVQQYLKLWYPKVEDSERIFNKRSKYE